MSNSSYWKPYWHPSMAQCKRCDDPAWIHNREEHENVYACEAQMLGATAETGWVKCECPSFEPPRRFYKRYAIGEIERPTDDPTKFRF